MSLTENLNDHDGSIIVIAEKAMDEGSVVSFVYDGMTRVVEVHALGVSTAGKPCLRGYQIEGDSLSGAPNWKLFSMHKIHNFKMLPEIKANVPRDGYQKGDKGMGFIFKEI